MAVITAEFLVLDQKKASAGEENVAAKGTPFSGLTDKALAAHAMNYSQPNYILTHSFLARPPLAANPHS